LASSTAWQLSCFIYQGPDLQYNKSIYNTHMVSRRAESEVQAVARGGEDCEVGLREDYWKDNMS